jgi:hypothetical protein
MNKLIFSIIFIINWLPFSVLSQTNEDEVLNSLDDSCKRTPNLIPIKINTKWGYCNRMKVIKIKPQFDEANPFVDINYKTSIVSRTWLYATVKRDDKYYRIDSTGKIIEPINIADILPDDNAFPASEPNIEIFKETNLWGVRNARSKKIILPAIFDSIMTFDPTLTFEFPYKVKKDGKFGIARQDGKIVVPIIYDKIEKEGLYWSGVRLLFVTKRDTKYYVDYCGVEYRK